jgi:uncharacterized protein (DUF305 family)
VTTVEQDRDTAPPTTRAPRSLLVMLAIVTAVALFGAGAGTAVVAGIGSDPTPGASSVDAGFARDMATHHLQATEMAQIVRDNGTDPAVRLMAYDIETQQLGQVGQLRGWLDSWGQTPQSSEPAMAWMGHGLQPGELMPGMATTAELDRLRGLSGRALDVFFLQLMIKHHRGGLEMAQYGAAHASEGYVRQLAGRIASAQQAEVVTMEQMVRARGAQPTA